MSASESLAFDVSAMTAEVVEREAERLSALLAAALRPDRPGRTPPGGGAAVAVGPSPHRRRDPAQRTQRPRRPLRFTAERELVPYLDGTMEFGLDHEAQGLFFANMRLCAPKEPDSPATYHVTPPDLGWLQAEIDEWLEMFSPTLIGPISSHEAAPGRCGGSTVCRSGS